MQLVRLKKRQQFVNIANQGRKCITPSLILQYMPNETGTVQVGFTVTKKVGIAVIRNRVRRRLKEAVRLTFPTRAPAGFDYVIIGRKGTLDRPFDKIKADIRYVLSQVKKCDTSAL